MKIEKSVTPPQQSAPKQAEAGSFLSKLSSINNGLAKSEKLFAAKALDHLKDLLTFPEKAFVSHLGCNVKQIGKNSIYTIKWSVNSEKVVTLQSERVTSEKKVSEQFDKDWPRSEYYFKYPGSNVERLNSAGSVPSDFIKGPIADILGEKKAKHLTEVAHQAHQIAIAAQVLSMSNDHFIATQSKAYPRYDIEVSDSNEITLISTSSFNLKDIGTEKLVEGITITASRKNPFAIMRVKDNPKIDTGYLHEQEDGLNIEITYTKENSPSISYIPSWLKRALTK